MAKKLKVGNAILCEYVAMGANNKHILINVFSGDVIVQEMPADLRFGLYVELARPQSPHTEKFTFQILVNGEVKIGGEFEMVDDTTVGIVMLQQFPLRILVPSTINLVLTAEGYAKATALSKTVSLGAISQPSI